MLTRTIQTRVPASMWGHGALVVQSVGLDAQRPGYSGHSLSQYDLAAAVLYQATTTQLLAMNPAAPLDDVSPSLILQGKAEINTTPAHLLPMISKLPLEYHQPIRTAAMASNHAIRLALRGMRVTGRMPSTDPQLPSSEAFAAFAIPVLAPGVLVLLGVTGVAAIAGVTVYAVESKKIETGLDAHSAQLMQQVEMYKAQVAAAIQTAQEIPTPPNVVQKAAKAEESKWMWIAGGAAALVGAVGIGFALRGKVQRYTSTVTETRRLPAPKRANPTRKKAAPKRKASPKRKPTRRKVTKTRRRATAKKAAPRRRVGGVRRKKATPKRRPTRRKPARRRNPGRRPNVSGALRRARKVTRRRPKGRTRRG